MHCSSRVLPARCPWTLPLGEARRRSAVYENLIEHGLCSLWCRAGGDQLRAGTFRLWSLCASISTELSITPAMIGYAKAFSLFCVAGVFIALLSPLYPGHIDYLTEETPALLDSEEDTGLQAAYDQQLLDENGEPYEESVTTEPGDTSAQTNLANT